jgi:hypothetical protein
LSAEHSLSAQRERGERERVRVLPSVALPSPLVDKRAIGLRLSAGDECGSADAALLDLTADDP